MRTTAALVIIGDEVLSGKVADSNSPFLIRALRERGVELTEIRVVPDRPEAIGEAVRTLASRVTYLFTTGGIGPTHDDVTIGAIASAFGRQVVRNPGIEQRLHARYGERLSPARLRIAEVPDGAVVHLCEENPVAVIQLENVFILPGVPSLMRLCFADVGPLIAGAPFYSETIFIGVAETDIAATLAAVQELHPDVAIGSYPRFEAAAYRVKVTVDGRDSAAVREVVGELVARLDPAWLVPSPVGQ